MADYELLILERLEDGVAVLTLRNGKVNALSVELVTEIHRAADELGSLGFRLWSAELSARAADAWAAVGDQRAAALSQRSSDGQRSQLPEAMTPALARAHRVEPLTRREREIAAVAATGVSNSDIAERLHVSVRTVETHLHNIYRKLGIAGRGQLAAAIGPDRGGEPAT